MDITVIDSAIKALCAELDKFDFLLDDKARMAIDFLTAFKEEYERQNPPPVEEIIDRYLGMRGSLAELCKAAKRVYERGGMDALMDFLVGAESMGYADSSNLVGSIWACRNHLRHYKGERDGS